MTNVRADVAGSAKTYLSVHVGAVHVDQCSCGVDFRADCFDGFLEDAVGRRIRDHQSGERLAVFADLFLEVGVVDVTRTVAGDRDDLHAGHGCTGWIGSMRRGGNETDIAADVPTRLMVCADDQQAGVLALRAGIRLQGNRGKARDLCEPTLQLSKELRDIPALG